MNHTEWISKEKFGVPAEFRLKVTIVKDQYQFIVHHYIHLLLQDARFRVSLKGLVQGKAYCIVRCFN